MSLPYYDATMLARRDRFAVVLWVASLMPCGLWSFCARGPAPRSEHFQNSVEGIIERVVDLMEQGRYYESEPIVRQAYDRIAKHPESADAALAAQLLGQALLEFNRLDEAEARLLDAQRRWSALPGGPEARAADGLIAMARISEWRGDSDEAKRLLEGALKIREALLTADDPLIAEVRIRLAGFLIRAHDEAGRPMMEEALATIRRVHGERHPMLSWALSRYASAVIVERDDGTAQELWREALAIERALPRKAHPVLAECLHGLGEMQLLWGDAAGAEPMLQEALAIRRQRYSPDDRRTAATESALGHCLAVLGRYEEAEPLLLESMAVLEAAWGIDHVEARRARRRVVLLYEMTGQADRVETYRRPLIRETAPAGHP